MLKLLESMKQLYVCCGYVDMRKGIEGLAAVVQIKYGKQIEVICTQNPGHIEL